MKKLITYFSLITFFVFSYTSTMGQDINIKEIRHHVNSIANGLMEQERTIDNMYIRVNNNGVRYIFIENSNINGLKSDEGALSFKFSKLILDMIFKSMNYNLEKPLSFNDFKKLLESKSIHGMEYKTKNNSFVYSWIEFNHITIYND